MVGGKHDTMYVWQILKIMFWATLSSIFAQNLLYLIAMHWIPMDLKKKLYFNQWPLPYSVFGSCLGSLCVIRATFQDLRRITELNFRPDPSTNLLQLGLKDTNFTLPGKNFHFSWSRKAKFSTQARNQYGTWLIRWCMNSC